MMEDGVPVQEEDHDEFGVPVQAEDATTTTDSGYVTGESLPDSDIQPDGDGRGPPPPYNQHPQQHDIPHQLFQVPQQPQQHQVPNLWNPNRDDSGRPNQFDLDFPDYILDHGFCKHSSSYQETLKQSEQSN